MEARRRAETLVDGLSAMGLDAYVPGELDLALGWEAMKAVLGRAKFPVVGTNVEDRAGKRPFAPFAMARAGNLRVAVLGFVDPALLPGGGGLAATDPARAAKEALAEAGPADLVVCLAHVAEEDEARLSALLPQCDALLMSHGGSPLGERASGRPALARAANRGRILVKEVLELGKGFVSGRTPFAKPPAAGASARTELVPLEATLPDDPAVAKLVVAYQAERRTREKLSAGVHPADEARPETSGFAGARSCAACHARAEKQWQGSAHAHALATLQKSGHELDKECIGCHATGWEQKGGFDRPAAVGFLADVQCEACHGAAKEHIEKGDGSHVVLGHGDAKLCLGCHTGVNDPDFEYNGYLARIRHW